MNFNAAEPVNQGGVAVADPLSNLQDVVDAAKQEAAAQTAAPPLQTPAATPQDQFVTQFGSASQPPAQQTEVSTVPDISGLASESVAAPVATEASSQPLPSPAEKLKEEISASVDKFLEEVTKEKAAV